MRLEDEPWLRVRGVADGARLSRLATTIHDAPIHSLPLLKAFTKTNQADAFAAAQPPLQWFCQSQQCADIFHKDATTLADALAETDAPLSARVSTASLRDIDGYLDELATAVGRRPRDADAYLTSRTSSASLGWHIDDVDVLLVMLSGAKRFRVAGTTVGSEVIIDRVLEQGDCIYIPALTFHSGGCSTGRSADSTLLSVAFAPRVGDKTARDAVAHWRSARDIVSARLPRGGAACDWHWARDGGDGRRWLRELLSLNPLLRTFVE